MNKFDVNNIEQAVVFDGAGESLIGVLSVPQRPFDTAVIVIVGGPQYRAGSHRQFVLLARRLAQAGYVVLRFDYRGMGDSGGEPRNFEHVSADVAAAIDLVTARVAGVKRVVLWGLCDGASAALLYCHETRDARVAGLCLLNPWVRSEVGLARTQVKHYYTQRLMQREFWSKLLSGKVAASALSGLVGSLRVAAFGNGKTRDIKRAANLSFQQRMAAAWNDPSRSVLLLLSGNDFTAREFLDHASGDAAWRQSLTRRDVVRRDLPQADHTFSNPDDRRSVERLTLAWLGELTAGAVSPDALNTSLALA